MVKIGNQFAMQAWMFSPRGLHESKKIVNHIEFRITCIHSVVHAIGTHVKTHSLFLPVDRLEHGCWQACQSCMLEQTVHGLMNEENWTTLFMYDIEYVVKEWWNNKIEQIEHRVLHVLTYANRQAVTICWKMIEQYCYFTNHVNSVVTGLLSQQPCNSLWYLSQI